MNIARKLAVWDLLSQAATILTVAALILGWSAAVLEMLLGTIQADPATPDHYRFVSSDIKLVPALTALSTVVFLLAGLIAMAQGEYRRLSAPLRAACWGAAILCGIWSFAGYEVPSLQHILLDPTSPLIWLMPLGLFAGMRRELWPTLQPVIRLLAYTSAVLGLFSFFTIDIHHYGRFADISPPLTYTKLLIWFGAFLVLQPGDSSGYSSPVRLLPLAVCLLLALFTQSRGWTLLCILTMASRLFGTADSRNSGSARKPIWWQLAWFVLLIAAGGWFLAERLSPALSGLKERLTEDTRTGEYVIFFSQVGIQDLILGQGPHAFYYRSGEKYQFLDNQLLWILFMGGVPALVCYSSLVLWPGFRPFLRRQPSRHSFLGTILILWALALAGSSTYLNVGTSVENLFIILLAGRCHDDWISTRAASKRSRRHS